MDFPALIGALAWPAAAVYIFGFRFRTAIDSALGRIREVSPTRVAFDTSAQQSASSQSIAAPGELEARPDIVRTPIVEEVERRLRDEIAKKNLPENQIRDFLFNQIALAEIGRSFAQTYTVIFGSQLRLLRLLHELGPKPITAAEAIFNEAKQNFPEAVFVFDKWLRFLEERELIKRTNNTIEITQFGSAFLVYLTELRLTEAKPG